MKFLVRTLMNASAVSSINILKLSKIFGQMGYRQLALDCFRFGWRLIEREKLQGDTHHHHDRNRYEMKKSFFFLANISGTFFH